MKIENSTILLSSQHRYSETSIHHESLQVFRPVKDVPNDIDKPNLDSLEVSENSQKLQSTSELSATDKDETIYAISDKDLQKMSLLQKLLKALTGKEIKFLVPKSIDLHKQKALQNQITGLVNQHQLQLKNFQGAGFIYENHSFHSETEQTNFNAQGIIQTADGRQIQLNLSLNLSRSFSSSENLTIQAGDIPDQIDPLVINYDAPTASLTNQKYSFDLDSDGTSDQISFAGSGSGFLALDLNNDGRINNGSELFGPQSGDGFSDLSQYDSDGNQWIDENDPIYDKLRIWIKDENGNDSLFALGQKGIGAIYLGNISTSFNLKNTENQSQGQLQKTGFFLKENGSAGTIQHIDLTV